MPESSTNVPSAASSESAAEASIAESPARSASDEFPLATVTGSLDVIDNLADLELAAAALANGNGPVAVDAERANGFRYSSRAYLLQFYRRGAGTFLVDPPAIGDVTAIQDAIGGEEWIIHAASQDLPCLRELSLAPARLFDTELGARIAGFERVGLAAVVERLLSLRLKKEHAAADWSSRPIPQSWLEYAALDVELLVDLRDALAGELAQQGKIEIAEEEFEATRLRAPKPPAAEPWRRLSGIHGVKDRRTLAVARALWLARDAYAREIDGAPGRLVPDSALLAAATSNAQTKSQLAALKSFNGRASRSELDRWWDAIEAGRASEDLPALRLQSDGPPPPRFWKSKRPDAAARLEAARTEVTRIASELRLPVENLLTPDTLRRVAWQPSGLTTEAVGHDLAELGARSWQIAATAQVIASAFVQAPQSVGAAENDES